MSKQKDVVVNLSKKHPKTGEPVQAGHMFVTGTLGGKSAFYEIDSEKLSVLKNEDLQNELYKLLHVKAPH